MKLKKLGKIAAAAALGLSLLVSPMAPAKAADPKDLEKLIGVCWEKGTLLDIAPASYIGKSEKLGKDKDRMLYFTMVYEIDGSKMGASLVYFIEEEWTRMPGGTDIPHSHMDNKWFEKFKGMERYVVKQKIIYDGGDFGKVDGKPDKIEVKTITRTVEGEWMIDTTYHPAPESSEVQKLYDHQVKEMVEIADYMEGTEEEPEYKGDKVPI
ncbi:MAG: hypothetical protein Q8O03_03110 [Nanoarchaeota archaeon]|nr:hypothetical protein [Nanoarchaeota archaeon]